MSDHQPLVDALEGLTAVETTDEAPIDDVEGFSTVLRIYTDLPATRVFEAAEAEGYSRPDGTTNYGVKTDETGRYVEVLQ